MKSIRIQLGLLIIILFISSCAVNREYKRVTSLNKISSYEYYQKRFPKSKNNSDVKERLHLLYDERDWKKTVAENTTISFKKYLKIYPTGQYVLEARNQIEILEKEKELKDAWVRSQRINTIFAYENFIKSFPDSKYTFTAKNNIARLTEENDWNLAIRENSRSSYQVYQLKYPTGRFVDQSKTKIRELEEDAIALGEWRKATARNTYHAYSEFHYKYRNSSYASLAEQNMRDIERRDWELAKNKNTIGACKNYISKYPYGTYAEEANKKIIDLEVDGIFKGDYGQLPPMNKSSSVSHSTTNDLKLFNNTQYTLTIRYSGIESKKIVISPHGRTSVTLKPGTYKIAASVNASNVRNYAGTESLSGGEYGSEFYIQTQSYQTWR